MSLAKLTTFFDIQTNNTAVRQKGHLLQVIIILLTLLAVARASTILLPIADNTFIQGTMPPPRQQALIQAVGAVGLAAVCLAIVRSGRLRLASHLFFLTLNLIFFILLVGTTENTFFPYLMLISVIAIATLDSVRASMIYACVIVAAVSSYYYLANTFDILDIAAYIITLMGVSLVAWATADYLQSAIRTSQKLAQQLQKRARQLQKSAQISQTSGASLELKQMLHSTCTLIRDQFGYYHISIFLLDDQKKNLVLKEVSSDLGASFPDPNYRIPINQKSIIGWVAVHGQARISSDVNADPFYMREPLLRETAAELALPLLARGQLVGVLDVQSKKANAFSEEDKAILQIMANQVAVNIDNALLFAQTESRLNETRILYNFNTLLTTTLDVGEIYRRAARALTTQLSASRCALFSWEEDKMNMISQVDYIYDLASGVVDEYELEQRVYDLAHHPGSRKVLLEQHTHIQRADDDNMESIEKQHLADIQQWCYLELPLVHRNEAIGLVRVYRNRTQAIFDQDEIQLAQTMANQTAVALANAILTSETQGRVAHLSSLNRLSAILSEARSLKDIFDGARREIMSLIEATGMSISLLTEEGDKLNWIYGYEYGQEVDLSQIPPLSINEGFSGHVARTREVLYVQKADEESKQKYQSIAVGAQVSTWLGLPMVVANELIGVLAVENETDFSEREIELMKTITGPLAIAIKNLLQFDEIQQALVVQSRQRVQLQTAAAVAAAAASELNPDKLMQDAVDLIKEQFELYYVGLFLTDEINQFAVLTAGTGIAGQRQIAEKRQLQIGGQSLIGGATKDGQPRITQDVTLDDEWLPNPHLPETRSELALPLRVRDSIIGALTVQSEQPNLFTEELISTLQTMSDQLAIAIDNARLLAQSEARAERQATLNEISAQLYRSSDVEEIIGIGLQALAKQLPDAQVNLQIGHRAPPGQEADNGK